jgi:branched-chain amino acid transport system ATP-binding protein
MALILRVRDRGVTVLLIEHHMRVVMNICQAVTVIDFGETIAQGTPRAVAVDAKVIEAYLGREAVHA